MCDRAPPSHEFVSQARNPGLPSCLPRSIIATSSLSLKITARISLRNGHSGNNPLNLSLTRARSTPSGYTENSSNTLEAAMNSKSGSRDGSEDESSSFDFLELKRELEKEGSEVTSSDEEDLVQKQGLGSMDSRSGEGRRLVERPRGGRQMMRRSSLITKPVTSIESVRSLGFVSQLWVDTASWLAVLVEVRPTLLSGEIEKFLLRDIFQVGDVVLVQDESVTENGWSRYLGYNVVTSGRHNVGKVRGYTFNINSGEVELLELDSFGISFVPSSLVSTYCFFVEDVLEVVSDSVVVHEDAVSRVQRLTKGFWDAQSVDAQYVIEEYPDFGGQRMQSAHRGKGRKNFGSQKFPRKMSDVENDWELPMD